MTCANTCSAEPYSAYLPYITSNPVVCHRRITQSDIGLILASGIEIIKCKDFCYVFSDAAILDGFWDNISAKEIAGIFQAYCLKRSDRNGRTSRISTETDRLSGSSDGTLATILLDKCIENAAKSSCISVAKMRKMPPGPERRRIIDDITVLVILFDHRQ
jgi:hypothetical protein